MARTHNPDDYRMSLGDHLEELRFRILIGLAGPAVGVVIALIFGKRILAFLVQPYVAAQAAFGHPTQIEALSYAEGFSEYLKISLISGLILGLPWLVWQMWKFVESGLYPSERKLAIGLLPGSMALVALGLSFMYFVMLPVILAFMIGFSASIPMPEVHEDGWFPWVFARLVPAPQVEGATTGGGGPPTPDPGDSFPAARVPPPVPVLKADPTDPADGQIWIKSPEQFLRVHVGGRTMTFMPSGSNVLATRQRLTEYTRSVMWLGLAFAVGFQLPLVMLLVSSSGLVGYTQMARSRKYAVLGCFVAGALLTPADPISQCLLAMPLYVLYEFGLILTRWSERVRPAGDDGG